MESYELTFGKVTILRKDIAEIVISDGIEVSLEQIDEADIFLIAHLEAPFSLLFNKKNQYSFHYDAQITMGTYKELNAIAVISYSKASDTVLEVLRTIPREVEWNMQVFSNRTDALAWLEAEQEKIKQNSCG